MYRCPQKPEELDPLQNLIPLLQVASSMRVRTSLTYGYKVKHLECS